MAQQIVGSELIGKRIVIIEDEGVSLMAFQRICKRAGLIVVGLASNGSDGVALVLAERPDIVLIDINMPIMDGLEAARLILSELRVCLVFLTALSDPPSQERIAQVGCHGSIGKPVVAEILIAGIDQAYRRFLDPENACRDSHAGASNR